MAELVRKGSLKGPPGKPGVVVSSTEPADKSVVWIKPDGTGTTIPPGVVVSDTEPDDKNVVWIEPDADPSWVDYANAHVVATEAERRAVDGKLPKGTVVYVIATDTWYKER